VLLESIAKQMLPEIKKLMLTSLNVGHISLDKPYQELDFQI
jgi:hypothetical protein